jgi:DNA mismatch repair ATPase MutS
MFLCPDCYYSYASYVISATIRMLLLLSLQIVPDNDMSVALVDTLQEEFLCVRLLKRRYFSEASGAEVLKKMGTPESLTEICLDETLFLALAAAAALFSYVENIQACAYNCQSLHLKKMTLEGLMKLDIQTVKHLEILSSLDHQRGLKGSLFGMLLPHTRSKGGARLLRSTLLQPVICSVTLAERYKHFSMCCHIHIVQRNTEMYHKINTDMPPLNAFSTVRRYSMNCRLNCERWETWNT